MKDFVIKGHICYTPALGELVTLENGYAVCVDGCCAGVFDALPEEYAALPLRDFGDRLVIPGLVDLHIHAAQYSYRGLGMDLELLDWLDAYAFPEESKYADPDYARLAYGIFADAMKRGATTRACIFASRHRGGTGILMELMEETGLISCVGKVNMDRDAPEGLREESAHSAAEETLGWIEDNRCLERTRPILTPRFIPSCTDELMEKLGEIQRATGVAVQSHISENHSEIAYVRQLRPQDEFYGQGYDKYGLFGRNHVTGERVPTVMSHCVWSSDEELELMKAQGVFIAHCPASNMNVSSGIAPIRRYLEGGQKVGLGTDIAGGQSDSVFRAMTDAIQVSKLYWRLVDQTADQLTFPEAFYMGTKGGGEFFGRVGSFEPGYEFDAVVLDDSRLLHPQPLTVAQRLERAAYLSVDHMGVHAKYVAGRELF